MNDQSAPQDLIYALAISPNFSEDGLCFAARSSALYRSEDGGENWQLAYSGLEPGTELPTTAVVLSPTFTTDRSLFAGVTGVVMRSSDAGVTWHYSPLASPPPIIAALAVSPNYLSRLFRRETGLTLTTYIQHARLEQAKRLLADDDRSISEIAYQVGYQNYRDFYRNFVKYEKASPRHVRQTLTEGRER